MENHGDGWKPIEIQRNSQDQYKHNEEQIRVWSSYKKATEMRLDPSRNPYESKGKTFLEAV